MLEGKRYQNFEVTISNRKNIYLNIGLLQLNIIDEMDALVIQSGSVNEISIWNTKEGFLLDNFSMDSF